MELDRKSLSFYVLEPPVFKPLVGQVLITLPPKVTALRQRVGSHSQLRALQFDVKTLLCFCRRAYPEAQPWKHF